MAKIDIIKRILESDIFSKWHWFHYHFNFYNFGREHLFAKSIVECLDDIENKLPEASIDLLKKLSSINGEEKNYQHYEQLMQVLAELLIIHKVISFNWNALNKFEYEPKTSSSKKNPEINILTDNNIIGIEVKSPNLIEHQKNRNRNKYQLISRNPLSEILPEGHITFPRDNPIKDFLISADKKFESFKQKYDNYISILFIVWDDHINEPISALLSKPHGIFMEDSFAKDKSGEYLKFKHVDYVIISRHRFQFQQMAGEFPYPYKINHPMDYGEKDCFPFKVIIKNPNSDVDCISDITDCFQSYEPSSLMGAEYHPGDFISWINPRDVKLDK